MRLMIKVEYRIAISVAVVLGIFVVFYVGYLAPDASVGRDVTKSSERDLSSSRPAPNGQFRGQIEIGSSADSLLHNYARSHVGHLGALEALEEIYSRKPTASLENIRIVKALLSREMAPAEKALLVRMYAAFFRSADPELQTEIADDLAQLVRAGSPTEVGRAAALGYSRLGYFPDSLKVLKVAMDSQFIDLNEYYGDIAHLVPFAPDGERSRMISMIADGQNRFATEVLASLYSNEIAVGRLGTSDAKEVAKTIMANEPIFSGGPESFGLIDAVRYESWLSSAAVLNQQLSGEGKRDFIIRKLTEQNTDPRKVLGVLVSPTGVLVLGGGGSEPVQQMVREVNSYGARYPANESIQDALSRVNAVIKEASGDARSR